LEQNNNRKIRKTQVLEENNRKLGKKQLLEQTTTENSERTIIGTKKQQIIL